MGDKNGKLFGITMVLHCLYGSHIDANCCFANIQKKFRTFHKNVTKRLFHRRLTKFEH